MLSDLNHQEKEYWKPTCNESRAASPSTNSIILEGLSLERFNSQDAPHGSDADCG